MLDTMHIHHEVENTTASRQRSFDPVMQKKLEARDLIDATPTPVSLRMETKRIVFKLLEDGNDEQANWWLTRFRERK